MSNYAGRRSEKLYGGPLSDLLVLELGTLIGNGEINLMGQIDEKRARHCARAPRRLVIAVGFTHCGQSREPDQSALPGRDDLLRLPYESIVSAVLAAEDRQAGGRSISAQLESSGHTVGYWFLHQDRKPMLQEEAPIG